MYPNITAENCQKGLNYSLPSITKDLKYQLLTNKSILNIIDSTGMMIYDLLNNQKP